jgi:hypothetical protein
VSDSHKVMTALGVIYLQLLFCGCIDIWLTTEEWILMQLLQLTEHAVRASRSHSIGLHCLKTQII